MVTVKELLSQPLFAEFISLTKPESLDNVVNGTGIFDWETPDVIHTTFESGELVLAKLDKYYQAKNEYRECIRLMIERQVAVIAFKIKPDEVIPQEFIDYANLYNVVLLTFKEIFYDEIIYFVRTMLLSMNSNELLLEKVKKLLLTRNEDRAHSLIQKINALFKGQVRSICIARKSDDSVLDGAFNKLRGIVSSSDTIVRCRRCILVFMSYGEDDVNKLAEDNEFIEKSIEAYDDLYIGYSSLDKTSSLREIIEQSITAVTKAMMDDVPVRTFAECDIVKILLPILDTPWAESYYEDFSRVLTEYDEKHNANFNETLITYVESENDIAQTAEKLYQHGNTIRYRLGRIQKLLGFESEMEFNIQSAVYVKLHQIKEIRGTERLI